MEEYIQELKNMSNEELLDELEKQSILAGEYGMAGQDEQEIKLIKEEVLFRLDNFFKYCLQKDKNTV